CKYFNAENVTPHRSVNTEVTLQGTFQSADPDSRCILCDRQTHTLTILFLSHSCFLTLSLSFYLALILCLTNDHKLTHTNTHTNTPMTDRKSTRLNSSHT